MHYYLDTEFIEDGSTIDLISIGIVAEDGREYYAINYNCDFSKADYWVLENVLKPMGLDLKGFYYDPSSPDASSAYRESYSNAKTKSQITHEVAMFSGCDAKTHPWGIEYYVPERNEKPEFWANYGASDWVAFYQLWGRLIDLPDGFPWYFNELKQEANRIGGYPTHIPNEDKHNALADARWNKRAYDIIMDIQNAA